jgi:NitT/TauT family transport system substrate-binding protein
MFLSTAIKKRAEGVRLVNLAQIVQRSSLMLVARRSSGITTPRDIDGRKVGLWGDDFRAQPLAFFKEHGLKVRIVPQSGTMNLFLRGGVDVASAMWYNEYHTIVNSGIDPEELTVFFLFAYGLNFPEDGIYCLEETYRNDPDLCRRFVRASIEGWCYAFDHPAETLDVVMKYVDESNIATDRCHQKWMLERMKDVILPMPSEMSGNDAGIRTAQRPGAHSVASMGMLSREEYESAAAALQQCGIISSRPAYAEFYMDCVKPDAK